ncbi:hypothetical protein J437_LFUL008521 [Ladona fulva]|uniref:SANT domain-containing protein n=1 Tax=Ladona fulva TaxID=123851 RepID=A0A8K0JVJ0_LADFU|nr:hypothetical protein J437_LFUL008521 [Ladona fulva]
MKREEEIHRRDHLNSYQKSTLNKRSNFLRYTFSSKLAENVSEEFSETKEPVYTPQVEAISPTLPSDSLQEDTTFRSTKDELLQQITKVDREIAKAESQIQKLKKKQQELEEIASKPAVVKEEEEIAQPKHQSLAQKIYADNRKKAQEAHSLLDKLGPKVDLPLYNQPSDTPVYHENKRRHLTFKKRLMEYFKRKHTERESREKYMTASYSRLMQEWLRKVEKIESSAKRKAKEAKSREFFEKVFPELRKQREDKERFNRVGARIKSEADLEEIMDGLQEQEMEDKKMRSYAVIPPILLDAKQRKLTYQNNNGLIEDFVAEYKERQLLNVWTDQEREIFREKYLQHPKNFGLVASYLERKSVCDCVQHYYLSKKTEGYRQLLRKSRQRARASRNAQKPTAAGGGAAGSGLGAGAGAAGDPGTTGVTTRQSVAALQREQQQRELREQRQQQEREREHSAPENISSSIAPRDSSPIPHVGLQVNPGNSEGSSTSTTTSAPTVAGSAVVSIVSMASGPTSGSGILSPSNSSGVQSTAGLCTYMVTDSVPDKEMDKENKSSSEGKLENKKERRKEEKKKKKEEVDSSDEECVDNQGKYSIFVSSFLPGWHVFLLH